jgi:hypothetical protein
VRSPSPGVARCSVGSLSGSRREDPASRWSSSLPPASEERRLASRHGGTKLVPPGATPPRLRAAGGAHRAACLRLELVVESVLRRVHPAESPGAPRHRLAPLPSGQPTLRSHRISRSPSRDRAACDSELLIRCSKRLGLTPWSPSVVALRSGSATPFTCPFALGFGRRPRQWFSAETFS